MHTLSYRQRRGQIQNYFDRTASDTWARLTSDAPVSRIRATVRAGRDRMRAALLASLPDDLSGRRVLDAGCGTGALAVEASRRGAHVVAIDVAGSLVDVARERAANGLIDTGTGRVEFLVGDMLDPALGRFDHVIAMDSMIHYSTADMVAMVSALAARTEHSINFTFAPRSPMLNLLFAVGKFFPRGDRAPAIEPVDINELRRQLIAHPELAGWQPQPTVRIDSGFYTSEAMEIRRG